MCIKAHKQQSKANPLFAITMQSPRTASGKKRSDSDSTRTYRASSDTARKKSMLTVSLAVKSSVIERTHTRPGNLARHEKRSTNCTFATTQTAPAARLLAKRQGLANRPRGGSQIPNRDSREANRQRRLFSQSKYNSAHAPDMCKYPSDRECLWQAARTQYPCAQEYRFGKYLFPRKGYRKKLVKQKLSDKEDRSDRSCKSLQSLFVLCFRFAFTAA